MNVDLDLIKDIQKRTDRIRNVCVLAHVDHGKTTMSDHLIASNGLIHPRLAGELRYLDSKEEEQIRGITMKSSSISLLYVPGAALHPQGPNAVSRERKTEDGMLINLIDSPGHVDFCSEVSTAARLSDGAFVIVDAVEGVCIQTHAVLRQAWEENVRMCLVINKIDRLILELRMEPQEAYERIAAIVSHVNMIVSSFASEKFISEADSVLAYEEAKTELDGRGIDGDGLGEEHRSTKGEPSPEVCSQDSKFHSYENDEKSKGRRHEDEDEVYFAPEKGNVAFASAHDGWAFRISQFADMYAAKMGANPSALTRAMWGNYALQPKTRRIVRIKDSRDAKLKPLFVQLALEPLWKAYTACEAGVDSKSALTRMVLGLNLQERVSDKALAHPDARQALRTVLRIWIPLSEAVLGMASDHLPSPKEAAMERCSRLLPPRSAALKGIEPTEELTQALDEVELAIEACTTSRESPSVVYVSKMVAIPAAALPRMPGEPAPANVEEERFLAFGRIFAGTVREGDVVHVLPSTYNPARSDSERQTAKLEALYLMMGRGLERLPEVPAGNVLAMSGLDNVILKSATLSSTRMCRPLAPMLFQSSPIVRVAVEPARPEEMSKLVDGLRLLHRADPLVQVGVTDSGEHVLSAAGEVHLETCIKDLRQRFAKIDLLVSPPLVSFRETVMRASEEQTDGTVASSYHISSVGTHAQTLQGGPGLARSVARVVEGHIPSGAVTIRVRANPLPASLANIIEKHADLMKVSLSMYGERGDFRSRAESSLSSDASAQRMEPLLSSSEEGLLVDHDEVGKPSLDSNDGNVMKDDKIIDKELKKFGDRLKEAAESEDDSSVPSERTDSMLKETLRRIWLCGPKRSGPNFLLFSPTYDLKKFDSCFHRPKAMKNLWDFPENQIATTSRHGGSRARGFGASTGEFGQASSKYESVGASKLAFRLEHVKISGRMHGKEGDDVDQEDHAVALEARVLQQPIPVDVGSLEASLALGLIKGAENVDKSDIIESLTGSHIDVLEDRLKRIGIQDHRLAEYIQRSIEAGIGTGFQLATAAGPLCDEPMWGVAFEVSARINVPVATQEGEATHRGGVGNDTVLKEDESGGVKPLPAAEMGELLATGAVNLAASKDASLSKSLFHEEVYGPLSGQVTATVRNAMRQAILEAGPRLVEVAFLCEIATSSEGLGAVYAVLGRRRARVLREDMKEGCGLFSIHAYLPAEASFGFVEELRRKSSGAASASLMLSHWERLGVDPFFVPLTEEQREEFGEEGQGMGVPNLARKLIDSVRRRKGLLVEEKVVESATRQRTLARKV